MAEAALHIGVDGRELLGQTTGVGRYLHEVLSCWLSTPSWPHRVTIVVPAAPPAALVAAWPAARWAVAPGGGGTWWEQTRLPGALRSAGVSVLLAVAYTAPLFVSCPTVVVVHDVSFVAHPEWFGPRDALRRRWLTTLAARRAHTVVTVSEFSAAEIVRWLKIKRAKIVIAPPGAPSGGEAMTASTVAADRRTILFVGSLFNRRHVAELIQGFARLATAVPDVRLVLVGANRTRPQVDPLAIAAAAGVGDRVAWRDYVSDDELRAEYRAARVFAFLSDYEGFGMTPLEAMAHGVPPVVLDTAVAHEVYGAAAVYTSAAPAAIAAAIVPLLRDDAVHATLVAEGRARLSRYSWPHTAAVLRAALERAAG